MIPHFKSLIPDLFPIIVSLLKLLADFVSKDKTENWQNLSVSNTENSYLVQGLKSTSVNQACVRI